MTIFFFLLGMGLLYAFFAFIFRISDPPLPEGAENYFSQRWEGPQRSSPVGRIRNFPSSPSTGNLSRSASLADADNKSGEQQPGTPDDASNEDSPDWESLVNYFSNKCPSIPCNPDNIDILLSPGTFFNTLKQMIRDSKTSVLLSALYIGDGPKSKEFVKAIVDRIERAEREGKASSSSGKKEKVTIELVLDYHRMKNKKNLCTVAEIIDAAKGREQYCTVKVHLFQTPSSLSNYLGILPSRAREVLGVQHTKIFIVDGKDLVVTGANLSDDYFTNRQDRYMVVRENESACAFYSQLVLAIANISHKLSVDEKGDGEDAKKPRKLIGAAKYNKPIHHRLSGLFIQPNTLGADPMKETTLFKKEAAKVIEHFAEDVVKTYFHPQSKHHHRHNQKEEQTETTYIFPTMQFGRLGIHHDASVVKRVLLAANRNTQIFLTSPYLNVYSSFLDVILRSAAQFDLVTASVETNGWKGQTGFAGMIPYFYLQLERTLYQLFKEYKVEDRVHIQEFKEPGTSFHAKGIWMRPAANVANSNSSAADSNKDAEMPYLAAYGSTNYGYRSVHKDIETEAFLFTTSEKLREKIHNELQHLLKMSARVDDNRFTAGRDGRFQPVVALVAQLGQSFL